MVLFIRIFINQYVFDRPANFRYFSVKDHVKWRREISHISQIFRRNSIVGGQNMT